MFKIVFPSYNGIVVHCEDKKVVSVINCEGRKKLKSYKEKNKVIFWHFPFFRGLQFFFCGLWGLFQAIFLTYDLCGVTKAKISDLNKYYKNKLIVVGIVCLVAVAFSAITLGILPAKLGIWIVGIEKSMLLRNIVIGLFKVLFLYIIILLLRLFPIINDFLRFNRAGDISSLGNVKKTKNVEKASKNQHKNEKNLKNSNKNNKNAPPKALNFLNFLVFVFVLDFLVVSFYGASFGFWFNLLFHTAVFLTVIGVAFEVLNFLDNCKWTALKYVCYLTACLVYAKPTRTHIETATVAMTEINLLCIQKERELMQDDSMQAFSVVYTEVKNKLQNAGINDKSEVDWLVATVLGKNRAEIKLTSFVTEKQYEEIMSATERRVKGESLDNIFGFTEFYGLRFDVNKKVLTPRMETELLVEQVLKAQENFEDPEILDIGTGSGAIAISVAKNCNATVTAVDVSKPALATAEANAKKNDVKIEFLQSNLFDGLKRKRKFDIIVSNPPYIPSGDIENLDKIVRECDPVLALDGGDDGLNFYRQITQGAISKLKKNGMLFYEVGKGQANAVRKIMRENGFEEIKTIKDYNKIERIVCGKLK